MECPLCSIILGVQYSQFALLLAFDRARDYSCFGIYRQSFAVQIFSRTILCCRELSFCWSDQIVLSNSLCSPFKVSHFGAGNHSLPINASPVVNLDTGQIQHFVQTSATGTTIEPCQAPPPLLPTNSDQVLNTLGKDESSNLILDFRSFSSIEKVLQERSYAGYLEGCDSVIVKGRLRVNVSFWEAIGDPSLFSVLSEKVIRSLFTTLLHQFIYTIIPLCAILILSLVLSLNFLKLVRLSSVLFLRWLFIPSVSVQSNMKKRLILDLRHVNFFVKKCKIKFEDAKSFLQCLLARPTAWACSFDIKSGFHHIEIF